MKTKSEISRTTLIAHRGNTQGPDFERENRKEYLDAALHAGFDAELDVWVVKNQLFLGHDQAQYPVDLAWLEERANNLWVHCKNVEALAALAGTGLNFFFHDSDSYTLTSHGFIWTFPGKELARQNAIAVWLGPQDPRRVEQYSSAEAICGDFVGLWGSS